MTTETEKCPVCGQPIRLDQTKQVQENLQRLMENLKQPALAAAHQELEQKRIEEKEQLEARIKQFDASLKEKNGQVTTLTNTLDALRKTNEEFKRQLETKDAQTLGRLGERELEDLLTKEYPQDRISRVKAGEEGADLRHEVFDGGRSCGTILWEVKNTTRFMGPWINKLRDNKQEIGAEFGVLVSRAVRQEDGDFSRHGDVLVVKAQPATVLALASILRSSLVQLTQRGVSKGDVELAVGKVLDYVTGPVFQGRLQELRSAADKLQDIQDLEKNYLESRVWKPQKREIDNIVAAAKGLQEDIAGTLSKSQ